MAGIDKAAIAFSIAIVAIGVGFAFYMGAVQDASPVVSAPSVSTKTIEPKAQVDPFADIADKVKQEAPKVEEKKMEKQQDKPAEKAVEMEDKISMDEIDDEDSMMKESSGPTTHTVEIPVGTSVPGCEESNACYSPANITINAGDTVKWINTDSAAHTVTGGSPADGPSGVFDSSLVMAGAEYAFTFNDSGNYDYFCMVHPWMVGSVTVN